VLDHAHFSRQLRAIPVFIAKLILIQNKLSPIRDADRRHALAVDEVMRCGQQREKQ
jgi:hypothetical protein